MWPFKKGKSRRELEMDLSALKVAHEALWASAKKVDSLLAEERIKTAGLSSSLREILPKVESLRASRYLTSTEAAASQKELEGLCGILEDYGLPSDAGRLRGHLAATEKIVLGGLRGKGESADGNEED